MLNDRKFLIAFLFITFILLLRDTPYLNIFIINKLWIIYLLVVGVIALFFIPKKEVYYIGGIFLLLFLALIFTFAGITIGAKVFGIVIYLLLGFVIFLKTVALIRNK